MNYRAFLPALLGLAACLQASIKIDVQEPVVERKSFDPANPPADMPKLSGREAAVTVSYFGAESHVGGAVIGKQATATGASETLRVDTVEMLLKLRIVIWLPRQANDKLAHHEDGHRQIAELFYRRAESIARREVGPLIGTTVCGNGKDAEAAGDDALKSAAEMLGKKFLADIDTPCATVQERYDQLTEHGTNAVSEDRAIREALRAVQSIASTQP